MANARRVVRDLFDVYLLDPGNLPDEWRAEAQGADEAGEARVVADYIAGMTDRYALAEYARLYQVSPSI